MAKLRAMAKRPFFSMCSSRPFVNESTVEFKYYAGFSISQKRKCIHSFHESISSIEPQLKILEVSTKSDQDIGIKLSAFNLKILTHIRSISVESAFQASKVFERGGPYQDLLNKSPKEAKSDSRIRNSGRLVKFIFKNVEYPLQPLTFFYDWLYINALVLNKDLLKEVNSYDAFTDIEFNPLKSINCQARSLALFRSLCEINKLDYVLSSRDAFLNYIYQNNNSSQGELFNTNL